MALLLLGPSEPLVPVLIKSIEFQHGYLIPFLSYLLGTLCCGTLLIFFGRFFWEVPQFLPRWLLSLKKQMAVMPLFALWIVGMFMIMTV